MTEAVMWIPMSRDFCVDLIRFSDGRYTPEWIGRTARDLILNSLERDYSLYHDEFGERSLEFAEEYFPHIVEELMKQEAEAIASIRTETKPLVWKEVTIPHGSGVRMHYGGEDHFAEVRNGHIIDDSGRYSPSEWASKVAGGTSRNAWRDLWFKEPRTRTWVPAQLLRDQARSELAARSGDTSGGAGS